MVHRETPTVLTAARWAVSFARSGIKPARGTGAHGIVGKMPVREGFASIQYSIVSELQRSWPVLVTLTSSTLGLEYPGESTLMFLEAIRDLTDSGMVTCEAIIISSVDGPRIVDAALTARGRAMFEPKSRAA
jgi:hypothetical protein